MSLQGDLEFRDANKITFIGGSSNTLIDLTTGSLGVGVTGTSLSSNLHVAGNKIKVGDNIFSTDGPHARLPKEVPLKKYPEIIFESGKFDSNDSTNTYVQAGYTVTSSTTYSTHRAFKAFNGVPNDFFHWEAASFANSDGSYSGGTQLFESIPGEWLKIEVPNKIKPASINLYRRDFDGQSPKDFKIYASITGSSWTLLTEQTGIDNWTNAAKSYNFDTGIYYKYFAILVTKITRTNSAGAQTSGTLGELEIYGYEEDPPAGDTSMDTTFTSIMNTPQTTGANVYVDAKLSSDFTNQVTGPTPVGTAAVHDNTNKYWELTGTLTSNITVEANTFLEGDQPHAVSVWFNSSNLEANTANTCVFSVSDQEHLNSQNLNLQSNTWHNLTYAYQGEGGSRVAYLDGRKVAEDQAEDTFGEYPPFAMTGYSQGGYVASASTTSSYVVYDNSASTFYSFGQHYGPTGGSGAYNRSPPTNHGGNVLSGDAIPNGEWHKIQMPHKLKLGSLGIRPRNVGYNGEPVNWYLYGSNDDVNWTMLYKKTDSTVPDDALETQYSVNATSGFSYFLIVMTKSAGYEFLNVAEFNWYGHRENDLVRLPDPTNVLKYPHVVMTGPAQRGYRVSVSSVYAPRNQREGWMAFNDSLSVPGGHWQNNESTVKYGAGTGVPTNDCAVFPPGGTTKGEWIKLELPFKLKVSSIFIVTAPAHEAVEKAILYGSNDDSNWDVVKPEFTTTLSTFGTKRSTTESVTTSNYYKYLVLQVTKADATGGGNNGRAIQIYTLNYYGIQEDISIPIQIGGGNIDKVANFRVYDKFVGEDQALEIWDAQKDTFRGVKNSVTLQKGRLGIGTTEPEGRLAVLDEPDTTYGIQEFPPRAISVLDYDTHIVGHGKFEFYSSQGTWTNSYRGTSDWDFTRVFTPRFTTEGGWHGDSVSTPGTYQIVGVYAPAITSGDGLIQSTLKDGSVVYGDWIAMRTPYAINVTRIATAPRLNYGKARGIGKFIILGSNNGVDWEHTGSGAIAPHDMSSATDAGGYGTRQSETIAHVSTNSNGYYYTYHRLVATHIMGHRSASGHPQYQVGGESLNQAYLRFFGTREQLPPKQSVLHDGQLTLTKNLTVPSIGPSVTNTRHVVPRRHKLVLEFDTSTNPTDLTTVNDTSEMGNDGTLRGNAYYSIGDKAFVFDGSGDYVDTGVISPSMAGARPHSMSAWFKTNATSLQYVTCLGEKNGTATDRRFSSIRVNGNALQFWQYSNDLTKSNVIHVGLWYHAVAVYIGGGTSQSTMLMYLNGEQITSWDIDTTDGNNLGLVSPSFAVGEDIGRSNYYFNGQISKPTLYDTALTAGDVKTLYDMGRGDSYHVTNFQNTLVGINLGNGRAPRSALDVRDQIYARTTTIDTFTGQHICFPDESMEKGLIVSAKKNKFVKLNGLATGKSAITIDESLPIVSLSNVVQDKACFGVVSKMEESNAAYRTEITGGLVSESVKIVGDNRAIVNSVGEGAIWVVDTNGPLESGDYITTSNVAGYGQKQDSEFLANYSVAKITMDCDFTASNVAVQTIKREETGTRIITEDAWNQLVEYDRYSNVEDEITTYYQIQRGENVLDDNGQLQFEDKTGATEEPYERRFLTTDGTQTDEANAVHIAAFVGCTYHCG